MNKNRRKAIDDLIQQVDALRDTIYNIVTQAEDIRDEEQGYAAVSALDVAISELQNIDLDSITGYFNDAKEG